ncbi:MAG: class I mannose-6-phosphate isomerase [Acholeplasmataceae bacterium]|nr:class I mannose-6-phosphate isomerase [Acholeplasmataceae bacterium]
MIIKLEPIPLTKVWGGEKLSNIYGFSLSNIGEIWGISAHKSNSNKIVNGKFKGISFRELYISNREYFGYYPKDEFPLLFKVIDAKGDLSVQVHPDNDYAYIHENSYGKDECWYILEAENDSRIQIGHKARNRDELNDAIFNNSLEKLLEYHSISAGDYYYIPSGKVHAICKNTTLLEVSQSSDVTYRLYDYNRLDNGKLRPLHIKESLDVISIPDTSIEIVHNDKFFTFDIIENDEKTIIADIYGDYIYIIEGSGYANQERIESGDFIMATSNSQYKLIGQIKYALIKIKE